MNYSNNVKAMKQIADNTMVNPHERIVRYNNFMSRLLSTPKVNIHLIIFKYSN